MTEKTNINFKRLFIIRKGKPGGWTNSTHTGFIVSIDHGYLEVKVKEGRDPYACEINTAIGRLLKEYEQESGEKIERYRRTNCYRFCFTQGPSGCQDTYIETEKFDGFPVKKFLFHESCFGKCAGFRCFLFDFLDLCVASGFFKLDENDCYVYDEENDSQSELGMQIIKPRLTEYEEGWTHPALIPEKVVYCRVCREKPEPDNAT